MELENINIEIEKKNFSKKEIKELKKVDSKIESNNDMYEKTLKEYNIKSKSEFGLKLKEELLKKNIKVLQSVSEDLENVVESRMYKLQDKLEFTKNKLEVEENKDYESGKRVRQSESKDYSSCGHSPSYSSC